MDLITSFPGSIAFSTKVKLCVNYFNISSLLQTTADQDLLLPKKHLPSHMLQRSVAGFLSFMISTKISIFHIGAVQVGFLLKTNPILWIQGLRDGAACFDSV